MKEKTTPEHTERGLVIAVHGQKLCLETITGELVDCDRRRAVAEIVTGDWVLYSPEKKVILSLIPRSNIFDQGKRNGKSKPIAANLSQVIIVIAPVPAPGADTIDRYLIAAHKHGLKVLLIFNKEDLADPSFITCYECYHQLDYNCLWTSRERPESIQRVKQHLIGEQSILLGQSGVGKSSLLCSLIPDAKQRIGALSEKMELGKHTTTTTKLFHLDENSILLDAPGIRALDLGHFSPKEILNGFIEIAPLANRCAFRNCAHHPQEKGCAILQAQDQNLISAERMASFQNLYTHS